MTCSRVASFLLVLGLAAHPLRAQTTPFTRGEIRHKYGNQQLDLPLIKLEGASSLTSAGRGKWMLGLVYQPPSRGNKVPPSVRFSFMNLTGPGCEPGASGPCALTS